MDERVPVEADVDLAKKLAFVGLPRRYWASSFDGFEVATVKQKAAKRAVQEWAMAETLRDDGLFLVGPPGTGKTHLLAAAVTTRIVAFRQSYIRFVNVPIFLDEIRAGMRFSDSEANDRFKELCTTASLVVLDDLGKEKATDWATERLYVLVESRYGAMKPTLASSNRSLNELSEMGYSALVSRLVGTCRVLPLDGGDHRAGART